jgi:membrane-bound lytic murein transglycosylase MltF
MKMMVPLGRLVVVLSLLILAAGAWAETPAKSPPAPAAKPEARQLDLQVRTLTGDFDAMLERRIIRVRLPYSRSLYFNDKGRERGLSADTVRDFERWLNKKYAKQLGKRPLTMVIIPSTRDKLLPGVAQGIGGDIAVGNITITEERKKTVDFVSLPGQTSVRELVVTGPKSPAIATADDLAGKTVHVRKASSYYESLMALNGRFAKEGKPAMKIVLVPDALEDEDMMEMLNAGLLEAIVVDDWKAKMWAQILPKIKVNEQAAVREGGQLGWAIRKGSPKLEAEILAYMKANLTRGVVTGRVNQYMKKVKQIKNSAGSEEQKRFEQTFALFEKYGKQYHFDPLMLAAQGFQESQLNQDAKSHVGAIGVMQIMPATGKELKVGDIRTTEANIHGGAKYMDQLMTKYFPDAKFDEVNRTLFAFASYNCGPGNVSKMRKAAEKSGFNPDLWFNNVEVVTAQKIGIETTTYVRNIYKYYVAYKLMQEAQEAREKAKEQVAPGTVK